MMDRRRILALIAAGAAGPAAAADLADQPEMPGPLAGYRALPLAGADGRRTTLGQLLGAQRPAIVSFWATWCAPCAVEGRRLARLRSAYPDARLAIVGLNVDATPDPVRLEQFRRKAQMNYTQGLDARPVYTAMARRESLVLPRTYVFDAAGGPLAAFGRFFGERTLRAIDAAAAQAVG
jgi:thiol-disulfide isomerase/thioredoxin